MNGLMLWKSLVYGQIRQLNIFIHWYSSPLPCAPEVRLNHKKKARTYRPNVILCLSRLSYV